MKCEKCISTVLRNVGILKARGNFFRLPPEANGVDNVMADIAAQATAAANASASGVPATA